MVYIDDLKNQHQKQLSELFDDLNKVEDEYTIMQEVIHNFRNSISLNKEELQNLKQQLKNQDEKKQEMEDLHKKYKKEVEDKKYQCEQIQDRLKEVEEKNEKKKADYDALRNEFESTQLKFLEKKWELYYNKQKKSQLKEAIENLNCDKAAMEVDVEKNKKKVEKELKNMQELLEQLKGTDKDVTDLQKKINILEGKEVAQQCLCGLSEENESEIKESLKFIRNFEQLETNYEFYEGVISELVKSHDKNFNQLLLLTVSSQMSNEDQVKRINDCFQDKNKKLLEYIA